MLSCCMLFFSVMNVGHLSRRLSIKIDNHRDISAMSDVVSTTNNTVPPTDREENPSLNKPAIKINGPISHRCQNRKKNTLEN